MNDEAVYRTAPATPGLLNIETIQIVYYLPGGYMMDLEPTCHMSRVTYHV